MVKLVESLAQGDHPVAVGGVDHTRDGLRARIDDLGFVFIKFTGTAGGTDLGVQLDRAATDLSNADFEQGTGTVHVEGSLTLDFVPVRCVADIDLATLTGTGHLVILDAAHS